MPDHRIAVVILNWNGKAFLERFLSSVVRFSSELARVVVVDNDSSDDSVAYLKQHHSEVDVICNDENGGFAKGYNDGLIQIEADYYVLLNSDVEVTQGWLEPMFELMENDASVAACQPKVLCWDARDTFEYAGAAGGFMDAYGYPFCRGRIFDVLEKDEGQYDDAREIFWATGACMMVRASLYHELGGLDEDFFAHMEEIDFCWRLKNNGHKLMVCPDAAVYHVGGGTLPKSSSHKTYLNFRNSLYLLVKNLPSGRLWKVLFIRGFLDLLASFKFVVSGKPGEAFAVWKAQCHFLGSLSRVMKKRRFLVQTPVSGMYHGCLVLEHFLGGIDAFSNLKPEKWE